MTIFPLVLSAVAITFTLSLSRPVHAGDTSTRYLSLRVQSAQQGIGAQQAYSPRAAGIVHGPTGDVSLGGALALGVEGPDGWRAEIEYTAPSTAGFNTQWRFRNPANGFVGQSTNVVELRSQRMMFNLYKDFALGRGLSVSGGVGLGWSRIEAAGYQNLADRRFDSAGSSNLAWGASVGLDYRFNQSLSVGVGYRYVNLGRYQTGGNAFTNVSGQRDEQHRGRLHTRDLLLETRYRF